MFTMLHKSKKRLVVSLTALLMLATIAAVPASAAPPTNGKWSNRTQTMYMITSASYTPWTTGAEKWKNNTNFKVTATAGVGGGNYSYYTLDVTNSNVDWDGLCTTTLTNGIITKAILNLNTHFTSQSKYTSAILAGLAGHELGHSLGLGHTSDTETTSIMYPYTFKSNGTVARALNPSNTDKTVVNNLYPIAKSSSTSAFSSDSIGIFDRVVNLASSWAVNYEDEAALQEAADLVVTGKVIGQAANKLVKGNYESYSTKVSISIDAVEKGEKNTAKQIVLTQMGAFDGLVLVTAEHTTLLQEEQEVKLYLYKNSDGTYRAINENDGIFLLKDGKYQNISGVSELK